MHEISHIKLSELTQRIEATLKERFTEQYWIVAEISGHNFYPNHDRHYFEFVEKPEDSNDPIAKAKAIAWSAGSRKIREFERVTGQRFTTGVQVLARVQVEFHSLYGLSLILQDIDQSFTLGNLERQRQETLNTLIKNHPDFIKKVGDEYETRNKAITLAPVIQHIAIIGSPNSEGYTDFTHTLNTNLFQYTFALDIYQSSVQGSEAEQELVNKLIAVYNSKKKYDCVVIIRGGGAKTDFLVFNTYSLSKAVAKFPIPIITGLGHHKDVSIVDLMTHTSTKTPTKAAEFIVSHNRRFEDAIIKFQKAIIIKSQQLLNQANARLNNSNLSVVKNSKELISHHKDALTEFNQVISNKTKTILYHRKSGLVSLLNQLSSKPVVITAHKQAELTHVTATIKSFTKQFFTMKKGYLGHHISVVNLMNPSNIVKKGFAIIKHQGTIVTGADSILTGSEIEVFMHDHTLTAKVNTKTKIDGTDTNL